MEWILLAGLACVAWTSIEFGIASVRHLDTVLVGPHARFGAVTEDGRPLDVVLDRRTANRGRREIDTSAISLHA